MLHVLNGLENARVVDGQLEQGIYGKVHLELPSE